MWIETREGSERESRPHGSLNHFNRTFLPGFLWPIILLCLVLSLYLVYVRVLPCVCVDLSAKMDSSKEAYGQVDITYYEVTLPPFLTFKEPFCACVAGKVSLTLRMRDMWSLSLIWAGLSFSSLLLFWSICPQGMNSSCSAWGPSISCLRTSGQTWIQVVYSHELDLSMSFPLPESVIPCFCLPNWL